MNQFFSYYIYLAAEGQGKCRTMYFNVQKNAKSEEKMQNATKYTHHKLQKMMHLRKNQNLKISKENLTYTSLK